MVAVLGVHAPRRPPSVNASAFNSQVGVFVTKTITHVMAISSGASNTVAYIAEVQADGRFSLGITAGLPYVVVFISKTGSLVGPDMIVSTIRVPSNDLDSLAVLNEGTVALGDITANATSTNATIAMPVNSLLSALGITSAEANVIGNVDDLALRLANPDVDMNGEIDLLENKKFGLDWHVRADTKKSGSTLLLTDVQNTFANEANITLSWTSASAYAMYESSFDSQVYVVNSGGSTALQNGGAFASTPTAVNPTAMSGNNGPWGPDYNMTSQEIGASDLASTFTYTLGSPSKRLRYSNVKTKTKAQLNADGVLLPFVKINTSVGIITGVDYKWMRKSGSTWVPATTSEVKLLVQEKGAYLVLYTERSMGVQRSLGFQFPTTAVTGTVMVGGEGFQNGNVASPSNVNLSAICNAALSYDDSMGLRLFAGAPLPASVTCP